jgi:hemolysin activation/secretion protein
LIAPFSPLIGSAFEQSATDAALLRLTDYPGVTVFGVVTPGTAVGTSDLVLRVQHEQVIEATIGVDNFGTKLAGEDRSSINLRWNSPLGLGDRFSIYGLHTQTNGDSAAHTNYGGADYRIPVFAARGSFSVDYSLNAYDVGESLGVTGRVKVGSISYHQDFFRTRRADFYGDISFADKRADVTTPVGLPGQEHVRDYGGQIGWRYSDSWRGFNDLSLSYLHGSQSTPGSGETQVRLGSAGSYNVIGFHLQRQQGLTRYQSLIATVGGQTSSEALPTLEQIALGGPANARGYGVADYVGDKGYYGTLEYVIGAPGFAHVAGRHGKTWGELLQFSLFADYARGITNSVPASVGVNVPTVDMRDWGAALQFNLPDRFYARVSWARQISPDLFVRLTDSKTSHVYGSLGFTF